MRLRRRRTKTRVGSTSWQRILRNRVSLNMFSTRGWQMCLTFLLLSRVTWRGSRVCAGLSFLRKWSRRSFPSIHFFQIPLELLKFPMKFVQLLSIFMHLSLNRLWVTHTWVHFVGCLHLHESIPKEVGSESQRERDTGEILCHHQSGMKGRWKESIHAENGRQCVMLGLPQKLYSLQDWMTAECIIRD